MSSNESLLRNVLENANVHLLMNRPAASRGVSDIQNQGKSLNLRRSGGEYTPKRFNFLRFTPK